MIFIDKIIIKNLGFAYDTPFKVIFEGVDLEIDKNWKTVIVGKNGRGKTTLLDLIRGKLERQSGEIKHRGEFSYFPFELKDETLSVKDCIKDIIGPYRAYEKRIEELLTEGTQEALELYGEMEEKYRSIDGYEIETLIEKELASLRLDTALLGRSFKSLSGGEKTKVKLLALFLKKGEFPLLDEPTNHLDIHGRKTVAQYLKNKNKGFICISHDGSFLDEIGDHVMEINDKRGIILRNSKFLDYHKDKEKRYEAEKKKNQELKLEISKKVESFREKCDWSFAAEDKKEGAFDKGYMGAKAARLMKRAKNVEKRLNKDIEDKKVLVKNFEKEYEIKFCLESKTPKELLRVENLSVSYGERTVIDGISFSVEAGERVAVTGANGSGKSSLLKAIVGKEKNVWFGQGAKISYIMQELEFEDKVLESYLIDLAIDIKEFGSFLAAFDMRGEILCRNLMDFSGGEKRKIALAVSLFGKSNFYIWDEPLNFLDFNQIDKLRKAILKYKPTMLFVEHDRAFIDSIATKVIELGQGLEK